MLSRKTTLLFVLFILSAFLLSSCNLMSLLEEEPTPEPTEVQAALPKQAETAVPAPTQTPSNLVSNLTDVKSAVIQIESQGTFVDPEFGQYSGSGRGTGFIIDESGLAVTNNHVVTGAALLKVWVGGDTTKNYNAQIMAVSECSDLALIDIEGDGFPYLEWYPDPIQVGLEVYAAGFPLGDPEYTLTKGIVSKENAGGESSWASVDKVIEHDATINPGNSGGPLVSADGRVVGVNYASYTAASQYFAIDRDAAVSLIERFREGENVDTIGVNGQAVVSDDGTLSGIWVSSIKSGSPADEAGIEPGDLITMLENLPLATDGTMASYCDIIRTQGDENTLAVEVIRFPTFEVLEGQINGRSLVVVEGGDVVSDPDTGSDDQEEPPVDSGGYTEWYDSEGALSVYVPSSWNDTSSAVWENTWELGGGKTLDFRAADMSLAPNLDAFWNFNGPGVEFSASRDWGNIGGYLQLLDGTEHWYLDTCRKEERADYLDEVYEGSYDWWRCGSMDYLVIAVRPIADPTAYLGLVQIAFDSSSDADWEFVDQITSTFDVIDYYALP